MIIRINFVFGAQQNLRKILSDFNLKNAGFTLIELMMVASIIGLLAAIAIPKFGDLIVRAQESAIKAQLGAIRGSISIYYADLEGIFPPYSPGLNALTNGKKYISEIPKIKIPRISNHTGSLVTNVFGDVTFTIKNNAFFYTSGTGVIMVNCTHSDSRGTRISNW